VTGASAPSTSGESVSPARPGYPAGSPGPKVTPEWVW